ncbi:MAG: hypothetical protein JXR97_14525 [Planctomycetes bacterium]|nr:hypothetical protein [Planctomycetota bacterium]
MPSSTSSSNSRLPEMKYGWLWVLIAILFVMLAVSMETFFRRQGHLPTVKDNPSLWSFHRDDVNSADGKKRIVIAGASRAQLGIVPSVMQAAFPEYKIKMLAINGSPGYEVVRGLCEDPEFDGILLWSTLSGEAFPELIPDERKGSRYNRFYTEDYHRAKTIEKNINSLIKAELESRLVILSDALTIKGILAERFKPAPCFYNMDIDRYRPSQFRSLLSKNNFKLMKLDRINKRKGISKALDHDLFTDFSQNELSRLRQLQYMKGGSLVMVRMPTTEEHLKIDDHDFPKDKFWDRINGLSGIPTIHFQDYPELADFDCPDTSHLDATDAPEFSRRLAKILKQKLEEENHGRGSGR